MAVNVLAVQMSGCHAGLIMFALHINIKDCIQKDSVCFLSDCVSSFLCICKFLSGTEVGPFSAVYSCARQEYSPFNLSTFVTELPI